MRTVPFQRVLHGTARMLSIDPTRGQFTDSIAAELTEFINNRVRYAWEYDFWPEITFAEQRAYRDDWDILINYAVGAERFNTADSLYYTSLVTPNTANQPDTSPTFWKLEDDLDRFVPYEQTGKKVITAVDVVTNRDPHRKRHPGFLDFLLSDNGVQVSDLAGVRVFVRFRSVVPVFGSETWDVDKTYITDDLVFSPTDGEAYVALRGSTGQDPVSSSADWAKVEMPFFLSNYAKLGAFADELQAQGQHIKARSARNEADDELIRMQDVELAQSKQFTQASGAVYPFVTNN